MIASFVIKQEALREHLFYLKKTVCYWSASNSKFLIQAAPGSLLDQSAQLLSHTWGGDASEIQPTADRSNVSVARLGSQTAHRSSRR